MSNPGDPITPTRLSPPARHALEAVLLAFMFAVAHTQSPLYYSNQNQYLLHGAAIGGHGHLANDWLATTRDPTPLFSALVAVAYRVHPWLLQLTYFALLTGYFLAARWLVASVPGAANTRAARVAFAALFTTAHAGIWRWASVKFAGVDYPWYLQAGLASQYLLGPGIQPSAFGVLLLVAVAAFANGRTLMAAALVALTVDFHGTYAIHSALLVVGFMASLALNGRGRKAALVGILALAMVAPAVGYNISSFTEADQSRTAEAHRILADVRIPHHSVPARWFDRIAGLQLVWMATGLFLLRRTLVFVPLVVATAGCVILTSVQLATGSHAIALLFPWRISVLLVPLATAVIFARIIACKPPGKWAERLAFAVLLASVTGGVAVIVCGLGYQTVDEHALYDHIRANARPDDVYLLPVQFPAVGTGRGAVSNTFAPPPRAKEGTNQIPVDLQRFRLATGARVYVDFKSVPYAPAEVLEWYRRMAFASELTARGDWAAPRRRDELTREGITHVVSPRNKPLAVSYLVQTYSDDAYFVYRVE